MVAYICLKSFKLLIEIYRYYLFIYTVHTMNSEISIF